MGINLDLGEVMKMTQSMRGFDARARRVARTAMQKTAADTKRDAQALAPVDTGNLRSSITYSTKELARAVEAEIGPTAEYGLYVEEGTSTMAPQPFLRPAADRNVPGLAQALGRIADEFFA